MSLILLLDLLNNLSFKASNLFILIWVKINKTKTNVVTRKNCISISSNQGKSKKANLEKPKILVKEVRLIINGIPQQKKWVRQLKSKKYEDKNLIISYYVSEQSLCLCNNIT